MSRRATTALESRLTEWAREYGGSRYDDNGWQGMSPLALLMKYHGRPPQGLNPRRIETNGPSDEVELAVRALEAQDKGRVPACVLRCEYFASAHPREVKLQRLSRIGVPLRSVGYSQQLRIAKVHVAGWLRVPFDGPQTDDERWAMIEELLAT
jgi:hypothetical protein